MRSSWSEPSWGSRGSGSGIVSTAVSSSAILPTTEPSPAVKRRATPDPFCTTPTNVPEPVPPASKRQPGSKGIEVRTAITTSCSRNSLDMAPSDSRGPQTAICAIVAAEVWGDFSDSSTISSNSRPGISQANGMRASQGPSKTFKSSIQDV